MSKRSGDLILKTVLVVDDDPLVALMMSQAFLDAGYNPLVAYDAEKALEMLRLTSQPIALMITEVRMPGSMDGLELGHLVAERYPDLAVLTMTGHALEGSREPVGTVLQKPFAIDHLLHTAKKIIESGRYWREMMKVR